MKTPLLILLIVMFPILEGNQQEFIASGDAQTQPGQEDAVDFFKDFKRAQEEVFDWLRDEYRSQRAPMRVQRDVDAVNGDTWYKNYQIKECEGSDKSSLCNVAHVKQGKSEKHAPEISELFDELDGKDKATRSERARDGVELQSPAHHVDNDSAKRINDKNMKVQHVLSLSHHHELAGSNYSPNQLNVEARLSAKQFLAKQQNDIHEIEMKHQHLLNADDEETPSKEQAKLNENQLRPASSNSNFPSILTVDSSSSKRKRSSGQPQHFDDQSSQKKNDLFDEVDEKLSKKEQQGFETLHRVKRRDVNTNEINRLTQSELKELAKLFRSQLKEVNADDDEIFKFLDDNVNINNSRDDERANTSTSTANQEMKDGNEKDLWHKFACNETIAVNNNHTAAKIKRDISPSQRHRTISEELKISDLISGELPNRIIKAVHSLVESNQMLKHRIKPLLAEPNYEKLKDSSKLSTAKVDSMKTDLVKFIDELVDSQIQMRSCIPLTPELKDFYAKLMGRNMRHDSEEIEDTNDDDSERFEKSVERFLTPKKRLRRTAAKFNQASQGEIERKCKKVNYLQTRSIRVPLKETDKKWLEGFFKTFVQICDELEERSKAKRKRSPEYSNVTKEFAQLKAFKDFVMDSKLGDF